jgi:hypothetical protein
VTVRKETRRGEPRLVIDINYRKPDWREGRYRRDAQVQTQAAARTEERRLLGVLAQHGEPFEPAALGDDAGAGNGDEPSKTFAEVAAEYRESFMVTDLNITTRRGYASVLDGTLLPKFGEFPLAEVDRAAACELDLELCKRELSQATRNNVQAVLRSVLRFAVGRGYLSDPPGGLPRLSRSGRASSRSPRTRRCGGCSRRRRTRTGGVLQSWRMRGCGRMRCGRYGGGTCGCGGRAGRRWAGF